MVEITGSTQCIMCRCRFLKATKIRIFANMSSRWEGAEMWKRFVTIDGMKQINSETMGASL
jgi:hypothetical protein